MAAAQAVADGQEKECCLSQDKKVTTCGQETAGIGDRFGPRRLDKAHMFQDEGK